MRIGKLFNYLLGVLVIMLLFIAVITVLSDPGIRYGNNGMKETPTMQTTTMIQQT